MSKQDIRNRIAAARGQSQPPAANHAARPAQHQAQTTGGAAGTSLRSRDIASRIEAARAKRIQELAASQTGLRRDTAARDDAGARDRFAQRHPEYTGGEAGAANRARNSEKVLRQAAEAAALGEGAKRLNKSENGFGGQDTRRGSVTGLFEQKDSSGGYPGFGGNAATDLRSPNGYVSMADLNAKTNGTSYPGVQGGTTVNGGESALSAELSGLKWDAEDSGKRVEQGIQAMEELAENYGTVQEDGSLAFYNQAAYEAYQKLLEGTLDAQEKQAAALQAYNRQWKTELWEGMSNEDKGQLLSRALQAGQDESGLIPDTGETRPGKSVLTETLESLAAGGNEAASSILRHPTDNAAAFQEKLAPEFVTEQLYRRDMEAIDREIAELEAQRDGMTMYTYDQRGDAGQRMAEEHRQAVADIDAKLDALRGEQYYTQAHLDLAKLDAETVEMVMQVPKWKDQRALNAGYESGDEFGGEAGAALHLELAEEAQANLEATETALRDRGLSDREIERLYDIAQREYNYEQTMNMREALSQAATQNFASGALLTAASVPMNLASGVGFIEQAVRKLKNEFGNDYVPLDDFSPMMQGYHGSNAIRGGIADRLDNGKWTGKALSFLYQTGASMLDSAATAAITAATGLPASVLLGGSAATNGMMEAKERGATDSQAIWIGLVSGVAEALFEKVSIDRLLGEVEPESVRALVRNMVTQAFTEGTEEVNTTIANTIADAIIMGDKSAIQTVKREYMAQGMDEGAAYRKAMLDAMQGLLLDFAGGALSGGLMSAAHGAAIYNQAGYQAETSPAMERVPGSVNEAVIGQKNSDADSGVIVYSGNSALDRPTGLAYTLASNRDQISDMSPVKALTGTEMNAKSKKPSEQIREFFAKIGNKVFRPSFGEVSLNEYGVGGMLNHRPLNRAKMVTLTAVPEVIENGRIIAETENWKNRGYKSIVFAAPVTINGKTVYVAAVVDQRPDNKFYLSECVDSEGNFVRIKESPTGDAKSGVTAQGGFTTTPDGGSLETINTSHPQEGKISGYKPSASKRAPATVDGTQSASNQTSETSSGPTLSVDSVPQSQAQYNPNFNQNQGGNTGSPAGRAGTQQAVRKATGYGEYGVKAFSELMDASPGMTFDQLRSQFQSAYELGLTDMPTERARLTTDIQRIAFNAGKQDYILSSAKAAENSKYVKVWSKGGGLVENDYAKALEAKTADTLNTIGKATGTKIIMEEIPAEQNANGYYQASDGTIHIDVNSTDPVMTVVKHELTHRMQALAPKEYRQFRDYAVQTMSEYGWSKDGSHTAVESQQHAYRDASGGKVSLDTESAMDEMAANFTEKILTDEDALRSFVEHVTKTEEHRTMGQKFFQAVREFIDKLKRIFQGDKAKMDAAAQEQFGATIDQLEKAEALWKEAYRAAEKHAQELSGKAQKSTARAGGDVQFAIKYDKENNPYVVIENDILKGVPQGDWVKTVKENLRDKFPNGVTVGKNVVNINSQSRREMTFSNYMQRLFKTEPALYADKLRATDNADEIVKASQNWVNEALLHPRKDDIIDFARGDVLMRIGNNDYSAQVVVGNRGKRGLLLYDIVYLEPTSIQARTKKADTAYTANAQNEPRSRQAVSAKDSMNQSSSKVNTESDGGVQYSLKIGRAHV